MDAWRQQANRVEKHTVLSHQLAQRQLGYRQNRGKALAVRWSLTFLVMCIAITVCYTRALRRAHGQAAPSEATLVDQTQNIKAMGYTDSRKIVRDSRSHLYIAYRKKYKLQETTAYHIFVAKSIDNGRHWHVLNDGRPIEAVNDSNQRVPAIAIDDQDGLHVVWYGPDPTTQTDAENQIKYTRSTDYGETWSDWQNIGVVPGYEGQALWQEHPTLFVDAANVLYVVWEGRDDWYTKAGQIKFTKSSNGGVSWTPWVNIAPSKYSRSRPSLVAIQDESEGNVGENRLYVFAYGSQSGRQQILYAASVDGGSHWSRWQPIATSRQDQRHVSAAVDSMGTMHVVWRQLPFWAAQPQDTSAQIYYASFTGASMDGGKWSAPVRVGPQIGVDQTYPSIAVDHEHTVWITWLETTDPYDFPHDAPVSGTLYYVAKTATNWSSPITYATGNHNLYPSLRRDLVSGQAQIDVVWLEARPIEHVIRFAQLQRPRAFMPAVPVTTIDRAEALATRVAWVGEFHATPFQLIVLGAFLPPDQLAHDVRALLILTAVVSLYVTGKFLISRWLTIVLR